MATTPASPWCEPLSDDVSERVYRGAVTGRHEDKGGKMDVEHTRESHAGWRLLRAAHGPMIITLLSSLFSGRDEREVVQSELLEAVEDHLLELRARDGEERYGRSAREYVDEWSDPAKGYLRKYYVDGTDEPVYDLTAQTEAALTWVEGLQNRPFVAAGSRLRTIVELMRTLAHGTDTEPAARIADLQRRRAEIDAQIARLESGQIDVLSGAAIRERYVEVTQLARELLGDFRAVEDNFRTLDRQVRERIALWDGTKADLLEEVFADRNDITSSDQGQSFQAFWDYLMSSSTREEVSTLLDRITSLAELAADVPRADVRDTYRDWLPAVTQTQRTVRLLSAQLRRLLDESVFLEDRRITALTRSIEGHALALREDPPRGDVTSIAATAAQVQLPFERPLYTPPARSTVDSVPHEETDDVDLTALLEVAAVDRAVLRGHVAQSLTGRPQVSLADVVAENPLAHGLAELVTYFAIADEPDVALIDEDERDEIPWSPEPGTTRVAEVPRLIFLPTTEKR